MFGEICEHRLPENLSIDLLRLHILISLTGV